MRRKRKIDKTTNLDAIKAMRRGGREAEKEILGPGFHASERIHKSKKTYTRKKKHKNMDWRFIMILFWYLFNFISFLDRITNTKT